MNRTCKTVALVMILIAGVALAQERFVNPQLGFGFVAGGAQGANSQSDKWVLHYGGFVQFNILHGTFLGQAGVHYNKLMANDYWAKIAYVDQSFLFVPYSTEYFNPFVKLGFGLAKPVYRTGTKFIGIVPIGAGVQTKLSPNVLMQFELFYAYSLSDSLDGRPRSMSDLNPLTNGGNDSFYGARVGLILGTPSGKVSSSRVRSDEKARQELIKSEGVEDFKAPDETQRKVVNADSGHVSLPSNDFTFRHIPYESPGWLDLSYEQKSAEIMRETSMWKVVNFAFKQVYISLEAEAVLREILGELQRDPEVIVYVVGHSDGLGNEKVNREISLYRANLVKKWLVDHGIAESRLYTLGKGSEKPIADNNSEVGRAQNRRVEFWKK